MPFRLLLLILLSATAAPSVAGELAAVINGKSFHLGASKDWNEDNYGLGFEYHISPDGRWKPLFMVNGFRDSDRRMSYMAGAGLHRNLYRTDRWSGLYVDVGINAFLMTRKDMNDNRPFPGALPSMTVGNTYVGFNLSYLPRNAVEQVTSARIKDESIRGILFLQFKLNLSRILND